MPAVSLLITRHAGQRRLVIAGMKNFPHLFPLNPEALFTLWITGVDADHANSAPGALPG